GKFCDLKKRFRGSRTLKVHFSNTPCGIPMAGGILSSRVMENVAEIEFNPDMITASDLISYISGLFQITDLEINTMVAEEIIAGLYREYKI
ncbi:MAG: hypothetical protein R6W99_00050, partial [Clostridia bacterium]